MNTENDSLKNTLKKTEPKDSSINSVSPTQNELDLEFNQIDPVIPKKPITQEQSILDKAKDFVHSFSKKEKDHFQSGEHQTHKFSSIKEENSTNIEIEKKDSTIPMTENFKNPEKWAILQMLPTKYRRLFIVLLVAIIILLIISWLKPSSETVQSFEDKNSRDIPTQFQPLNSDQPMEPTVLETLNTPNNEIKTEQTVNENVGNADTISNVGNTDTTSNQENNTQNTVEKMPEQTGTQISTTEQIVSNTDNNKDTKMEQHKSVPSKQQQQEMQKLVNKIAKSEPKTNQNSNISTTKKLANAKTLTIEKGKSLMQIFRENNLNIADVNAMTKVKGASNSLSSFKPGDKVQVSVNNQGRVSELRLENGSRFIRQNDGSYQLKK